MIDVKRSKESDQINLIDGRSGEFRLSNNTVFKKTVRLKINHIITEAVVPSDLIVLFSPIKKSRTDFIIEKCVELGVKTIIPIISDYTDIHNFK